MATYNSVISRTDAAALIPEEASREILQAIPAASAVLGKARRLQNMQRNQFRLPVLSALPTAYFVSPADTGLKETTEVNWENVTLTAEEIACIVPIPENVLADADYDIWSEIRPLIAEAFGAVIDAAMLVGTNAPSTWPDDLLAGATAAGHVVNEGSVGADIFDDIMATGGVLNLVEADGFMVNGHLAHPTMKAKLRGLRDSQGSPIFVRSMQDGNRYELDGSPIEFPTNGSISAATALLFSGDWSQLVYSMRQDITYKIATEGIIQNSGGTTIYNLFQQDMVALRCVMRLGFALPNPIRRMNQTAATRYPFAVLVP